MAHTIAIALRTEPLTDLTLDQASLLEEVLMDKRLKKAEAIKAFLTSSAYQEKKEKYQRTHAEFSEISEISIADGEEVETHTGEDKALEGLEKILQGTSRMVGFDLIGFQFPYILRRILLSRSGSGIREQFLSPFGTAPTALIDIKKAWMRDNREYSGLTLEQLCIFNGKPIPETIEDEAAATFMFYQIMEGRLL